MVKRAESTDRADATSEAPKPASSSSYSPPPTGTDTFFRKISAIVLIVFLYSAATPFSPISWVIQAEGGFLLDRLFAGILLFSALYFQWRIACQTSPVAITIPTSTGKKIVDGRIEK